MWYRFAIASVMLCCLVAKADGNQPVSVGWPLLKAYIPTGFDDNDKVQITVTGEFPSTCYRVGSYSTSVNEAEKVIYLASLANSYLGICLPMLIPYTQVMDVGFVPSGDYRVLDLGTGKELGKLAVTRSTNPGPDDHMYLAVEDAHVQREGAGGPLMAVIEGRIMHRCSKLDRVEIHYFNDTIVVQPIVTFREGPSEEKCTSGLSRVRVKERLKDGLSGDYLLHVRSMSGQAVNKLFEVD